MSNKSYILVNIIVLLGTMILFGYKAVPDIKALMIHINYLDILLLLISGFMVYILKCLRLYIILYEKGISMEEHLKQFCKTTAVSILLPFKLGELFKAYCYSYQLKNSLLGISSIIIDRFYDTAALLTILSLFIVMGKMPVTALFLGMLVFSLLVILAYTSFPAIYTYWNHYFLISKASENNLRSLVFLDKAKRIYKELALLIQGRSILLLLLSLIAWMIEIGSISILSVLKAEAITDNVSAYINAAMGVGYSLNHWYFIAVSLVLLFVFYVVLHMSGKTRVKL